MLRTFTVIILIGASFARTLPTAKDGSKNVEKGKQLVVSLPYWFGNSKPVRIPNASVQKHQVSRSIVEGAERKGKTLNPETDDQTDGHFVQIKMFFGNRLLPIYGLVTSEVSGPIADKENNNQDSPREGVLEKEQQQKVDVKAEDRLHMAVKKDENPKQAVELPDAENGNKGVSNEGALNAKQQQKEEDEANVSLLTVVSKEDENSENSKSSVLKKKEGEIVPSANPGNEETRNSLLLADPEKKKEEPSVVVKDNEEKKSEPIPSAEEKKEMISPLADAVEQDTPLSQETGEKETDPENENEQTKVKEETSINIITEATLEEIPEGTPDKQDKEEAETNVTFWQSIGNFFSKIANLFRSSTSSIEQPRGITTEASKNSVITEVNDEKFSDVKAESSEN